MLVMLALFLGASIAAPVLRPLIGRGVFLIGAAVSAVATVWIAALGPTVLAGNDYVETVPWVPQLGMDLQFRIDALSWVIALIVTGIGALVLLYCPRYFGREDVGLGRFAGVLVAFAGVMLGLVTADGIYLLFVFWEGTSVLSYLLIGHFTGRRAARGAAMQALLVTTFGGLVMLVGLVLLQISTGSALLSGITTRVAADPALAASGPVVVAVLLVLVGVATKSALVPFHFWLPGAMAAPTPVSAYLHAASMVKAGIYLVLRLVPGFAETPGFRETLIVIGVWTMCVGGWRALRQNDLKLVLAYGTVSQLGFLTAAAGFGSRDAALGALAMLIAHALFKAALFLIVGIIDHQTGTRDLRKLSGLGRRAPVLAITAIVAGASMAGIIPLWGFVAKEGVFSAFLAAGEHGDPWAIVAVIGTAIGSVLTVAYTLRFLHGAFATKRGVAVCSGGDEHPDILIAPILLSAAGVVMPWWSTAVDGALAVFADTVPPGPGEHPYHLAIWHGFEPALWISLGSLALGALLFLGRRLVSRIQSLVPAVIESARGYWLAMRVVDMVAARVTSFTQRGSLPFYLGSIFVVLVVAVVSGVAAGGAPGPIELTLTWSWPNAAVIAVLIVAAIASTRSDKRFQGVVLVGITGYGMAVLFAISGAPDLAITQSLIETLSIIVFVLVLRRLPARHTKLPGRIRSSVRIAIGVAFGLIVAALTAFAMGNRVAPSDGLEFFRLAKEGGHGINVVNVTLVDIRGWDTMGELSVLIAAATGIASLVYLRTRGSGVGRAPSLAPRRSFRNGESGVVSGRLRVGLARDGRRRDLDVAYGPRSNHKVWLLAGYRLAPEQRSVVVEVVARLIFHALLILSIFLLFSGHNAPGGGFAGGVVAGLAFALRYLAGGREELDEAVRVDAGRLLGFGLILAAGSAAVPIMFGQAPLTSSWIDENLPGIGELVFVTSTTFDIGVYLVVIGLAVDILRSLGSELDRQAERDATGGEPDQLVLDASETGSPNRSVPATRALDLRSGWHDDPSTSGEDAS